ncbi:MAG: cytosine deaminase [Pseudanabaenaceae cyanobacterium]
MKSTYWLTNGRVPRSLLIGEISNYLGDRYGLVGVHLLIKDGRIEAIVPHGWQEFGDIPQVNLNSGIVLPCFVDVHTHLDKGHIWARCPNPDGSFSSALSAVLGDYPHWNYGDIYKRMEFGLRCSYTHGTRAIRTHLDCPPELVRTVISVFQDLRQAWQGKIILQATALVTLDQYAGAYGEELADQMAEIGGILGGVAYMHPDLDQQLDRLLQLAKARNLGVDLHTDENGDPDSCTLWKTAQAVLRNQFTGQVTCGHCCSLSVQAPEQVARTIELVKTANIHIVSLPLCNLYLQDRQPNRTPYWRGITRIQELANHGVPVSLASDNCRDPFYAFGDHDLLQVFTLSVLIAHLDLNYNDWLPSVTSIPSQIMNLPTPALIGVGLPADLILFSARNYNELLSRPQTDRRLIRNGDFIEPALPSYQELDYLWS